MHSIKNLAIHIFLIVVVLCEVLAGYLILTLPNLMKMFGFGLHLFLVFLFTFLLKRIHIENSPVDQNFAFIALVLSLALPVYGPLGILLLYASMRFFKVEPREYFELDEGFLSEKYNFSLKDVDRTIISIKSDELEIEAFKDIFKTNDRQLEENAISKLSKMVNRRAVSILREVVETSGSDTKILAASALIDMEDKVVTKIEKIKNDLNETPDNLDAALELARSYDLYCHLGILDVAVENYYQRLALEEYRNFLRHRPDHPEANFEYGRILLKTRHEAEAVPILKKAVDLSPRNPSPRIWLAEAFYELGDYEAVMEVCQGLSKIDEIPVKFKEIVDWWKIGQPRVVESDDVVLL